MISGAHVIIYSTHAEADRAFLKDILKLDHVDAGDGWLIFALPPAELAVHPFKRNDFHELYLTCRNIQAFVSDTRAKGFACSEVQDHGWGLVTQVSLPGGGKLGVYEPRHRQPQEGKQ